MAWSEKKPGFLFDRGLLSDWCWIDDRYASAILHAASSVLTASARALSLCVKSRILFISAVLQQISTKDSKNNKKN